MPLTPEYRALWVATSGCGEARDRTPVNKPLFLSPGRSEHSVSCVPRWTREEQKTRVLRENGVSCRKEAWPDVHSI